MVIDKVGIGFILIIIVFAGSAILLIMGTVPEIFRQGEQIDQAVIQQHEDESRTNQTILISQHLDEQLDAVEKNLTNFINESEKRSNASFAQRMGMIQNISQVINSLEEKSQDHEKMSINVNTMQESLNKISQEILNISKEHKQVQRDHDMILDDVNNVTEENQRMLGIYGENSIEKFDLLIQKLDNIYKLLN